jgi:oligoribonuclease NrnB/cAMP/cGMP phosphodiesterase (DHH superfamily)
MELPEPLKDIVVIYHKHCQDGFGSAYSAWKKFGNSASYIPCSDRINPPEGLVGKELFIVDFSYSKEVLLTLEKKNNRVVVIDHHISAEEAVKSLKEYVFSVEHSGSYLSWQYFVNNNVPKFIEMLEIIDLKKDNSNIYSDVITYILSKPYTFEVYEQLCNDFDDTSKQDKIKEIGKAQNDYLELIIEAVTSEPDFVVFEGYTVPCVNFSLPINERSIALSELYEKYPPFSMSYRFDLALIAGKYGGGGHKNAAGFAVDVNCPLPFVTPIKDGN